MMYEGENDLHIKYFIWRGAKENYYELVVSDNSLIRFIHKDKVIKERSLNQQDIVNILEVANKTMLPIRLNSDEDLCIMPCFFSNIKIGTKNGTFNYSWNNEDSETSKKELKSLHKLTDLIENLIDIDFSNLDMPMNL